MQMQCEFMCIHRTEVEFAKVAGAKLLPDLVVGPNHQRAVVVLGSSALLVATALWLAGHGWCAALQMMSQTDAEVQKSRTNAAMHVEPHHQRACMCTWWYEFTACTRAQTRQTTGCTHTPSQRPT